jgi:hypothetical protein
MRRAKRKAARDGRTLTALIEDGLRRVLDERGSAQTTKRVLPPVSKAGGGLMPGFEWNDLSSAVQEMEDVDYARRHL